MYIDVRIPWEPGKRLGYAFNRMMKTVEDWVLVLDWDVLLLNVNWYDMCMKAIEDVGHKAGIITCLTNRIGCPLQKAHVSPMDDDIGNHVKFAQQQYEWCNNIMVDVTGESWKVSGMFVLTHREAYEKVGPVPDDKFLGLDNWYGDRLKEAGYRIFIMHGLYVFHNYRRQWK